MHIQVYLRTTPTETSDTRIPLYSCALSSSALSLRQTTIWGETFISRFTVSQVNKFLMHRKEMRQWKFSGKPMRIKTRTTRSSQFNNWTEPSELSWAAAANPLESHRIEWNRIEWKQINELTRSWWPGEWGQQCAMSALSGASSTWV